jgi:hypothetical protein
MSSASILLSISEWTSHPLSSFELSLAGMFIVAAVTILSQESISFACLCFYLCFGEKKKGIFSSVSAKKSGYTTDTVEMYGEYLAWSAFPTDVQIV